DCIADSPPFGVTAGEDWFGCRWLWDTGTNGFMQDPKAPFICTDITQWEKQVTFPDIDKVEWERLSKPVVESYDPDRMTQLMLQTGVFERMHSLLGFEDTIMAMYDEPEAFHEFMEAITEHRVKVMKKAIRYYKPDIITNMDDYGTQNGPMMSKEMFREFIKPYTKRVIDAIHEEGVKYMHHSCGNITLLFDDMVEMGMDAITAVAPINDVDGMIAKYGDSIVWDGGMNTNGVMDVIGVSEEEVRAEARRAMQKLGRTGSYVAGGYCNSVSEKIVMDEVQKYGSKFYQYN
ncbi:MAG: hypothetical protein HUJ76_13340, partial [Parasporobacterium sp.]|nr:hypothetical protein [Parasporobacterium sp.]